MMDDWPNLCSLVARVDLPATMGVKCHGDVMSVALAHAIALLIVLIRVWHVRSAQGAMSAGLTVIAAMLLAIAVAKPVHMAMPEPAGGEIVVAIDHSDSSTRDAAGFDVARALLANRIADFVNMLPSQEIAGWSGELIEFGGDAALAASGVRLADLPAVIESGEFGRRRPGTNGDAGLTRALAAAQGPNAQILLMSDGNWTDGDIDAAIAAARARGTQVHVLPHGSAWPASGLVAANLALDQTLGAPAMLRLGVAGSGLIEVQADEQVAHDTFGDATRSEPVRLDTVFRQRGLRFLDVTFTDGALAQTRRLYTTVRGPARVLAFGEGPWERTLGGARFTVTRGDPAIPPALTDYEVILIDALGPDRFAPGFPAALSRVLDHGAGLFLINGGMRGDPEAPTTIMAWEETALGPRLPLSGDGREMIADQQRRDIVLIVDRSASMAGWRLEAAKQLAQGVIDTLGPADTARVLAFADQVLEVVPRQSMDDRGTEAAKKAIGRLGAGGGTDARGAFEYAERVRSNICGIFFFSDGDFATAPARPGCSTTVFEIKESGAISNPGLARLGEVKLIRPGDEMRPLKLRFFEPETRTNHFRPEPFRPVTVGPDDAFAPPLTLDGLAIGFLRPGAERVAVHPSQPPDPLGAFMQEGALSGTVGVFMSAVPARWHQVPPGRRALESYLNRVLGWPDAERYAFAASEVEGAIELRIAVAGSDIPSSLSARLAGDEGESPVFLVPTDRRGEFVGRLPFLSTPGNATLRIEEPDRTTTSIPVHLPVSPLNAAPFSADEARTFGIRHDALAQIAMETGGVMLDRQALPVPLPPPRGPDVALHPPLIALALFSFACSLWIGRRRS